MLGGKANEAARSATSAATQAAQGGSNPLSWLLPLILLAALGYLGYSFFNQKPAEKKDAPAATMGGDKKDKKVELPSLDAIDLTDLKKNLSGTFEGLTGALESITDVDTAKGAISKIEDAAKAYAGFGIDKLPAAAKTGLVPFLKPYITKITELLEKAYLIPGVKEVVEPAIGPMLKTVTGLAG
jgi:hypothetical protein